MILITEILKIIFSFALLLYSADKFVLAASRLARSCGISSSVIGITLVGYGTSLPEFAVSSIAAMQNRADLSVANIVGSNIFNIAILIGLAAAMMVEVRFKKKTVSNVDIATMVLSALILSLLLFFGGIGRITGAIMIILVVAYTIYTIKQDKSTNNLVCDEKLSWKKELAKSIPLLAIILFSADLLINSSVSVARIIGISDWVIGATIIAAGTSMPEFAVTVASARRREFGILLGNIVGSNIFNILWILGFAALLNPLPVTFSAITTDTVLMILITTFFAAAIHKKSVTRIEGFAYITLYLLYVGYLLKMF